MKDIKRVFVPGSEWVYFKIYTGLHSADNVLRSYVWPAVKSLRRRKLIDTWFFIRYTDPQYHLRVRLHCNPAKGSAGEILDVMYRYLRCPVAEREISRVMLDTYIREVERYGTEAMDSCEDVFMGDSDMTLTYLLEPHTENDRWIEGLKRMYGLVSTAYPDPQCQIDFLRKQADNYCKEFGVEGKNQQQLNTLYRKNRSVVDSIVSENPGTDMPSGFPALEEMLSSYGGVRDEVLPSLIHMSMNRLFVVSQRLYEMTLYYLLTKAVGSKIARAEA